MVTSHVPADTFDNPRSRQWGQQPRSNHLDSDMQIASPNLLRREDLER